jgi:hypothetical protein
MPIRHTSSFFFLSFFISSGGLFFFLSTLRLFFRFLFLINDLFYILIPVD